MIGRKDHKVAGVCQKIVEALGSGETEFTFEGFTVKTSPDPDRALATVAKLLKGRPTPRSKNIKHSDTFRRTTT